MAGVSILTSTAQSGVPVKLTAKSVPSDSGPETAVVPSASKTCAVHWVGAASHMPPCAPSGSWSVITTPQAVPADGLARSSVKVPISVTFSAAGPDLPRISWSGPTMVIGPVVPGPPGRSVPGLPLVQSKV